MDEDIAIIDSKTRNEKIKIFLTKNKRLLILIITFLVLIVLSFYSYKIYKDENRKNLSDKYNSAIIQYKNGNKSNAVILMKEVIESEDNTYSPLALYFLIDNNLIKNTEEINSFFDILIDINSLETEIKNLIIYKKGLYNADKINENDLLKILDPLINSKSIWKSHALYLLAEFFYYKGEMQKSKEFYSEILNLDNSNQDIKLEATKRLKRDLSD